MIYSCKTSKIDERKIQYILMLSSDTDVMHLENAYSEYNITDIKKSSKSQIQYSAVFECINEDCNELEAALKLDDKVLSFENAKTSSSEIKASTGSKAHKTGRIGSQGGQ